jgi:hypothetical protein
VRENRTHGSEGGDGESRSRPLSQSRGLLKVTEAPPARIFKGELIADSHAIYVFLAVRSSTAKSALGLS